MSILFATAYNGLNSKPRSVNTEPTLTKQAFKAECDINTILKKYEKTGLVAHVSEANARYDDFSNCYDYQSSLNTVIEAQNAFDALPSAIRKRFANDPGLFMDFVHDPANLPEMIALGLAVQVEPQSGAVRSSGEAVKPTASSEAV